MAQQQDRLFLALLCGRKPGNQAECTIMGFALDVGKSCIKE
jgi:hypothetical protein